MEEKRIGLTFTESLEFEQNGVLIELGKVYVVDFEYDGVYYIQDEFGDRIGFEKEALDDTVIVLELERVEEEEGNI